MGTIKKRNVIRECDAAEHGQERERNKNRYRR
jgi:hypothetical protein